MGLLDDLTLEKRVATCKVRTVAAGLDADDRAKFVEAVENEDWPINTLSKSLGQLGVAISGVPIAAHRSKGCSCYRA